MLNDDVLQAVESASKGLLFVSEIDADLVPFVGPVTTSITAEIVLKMANAEAGPIEEISPEDFFVRLATIREWHGSVQKERAKKYQELFQLLKDNLRELKVFRVGKIRIDIYIIGINDDGRVLGIKTTAVET